MGKTIKSIPIITDTEVASDDLIPIEDVSKPKTKAITIAELIKRLIRPRTITGAQIALSTILPENINFASLVKDTNPYYLQIGTVLICAGTSYVANAGTTVTFPKAFAAAPAVTATIADVNNQTAWVVGMSPTTATLKQLYTAAPLLVSWVAIGKAAA